MNNSPVDIDGTPVSVGTKVKILKISESLLAKIPQDEVEELETMIGEIFIVYKIDEWGGVWVQKESEGKSENQVSSHSLNLTADEMQIVQ